MGLALFLMGVVMVLWDHVWRNRIIQLETKVTLLAIELEVARSPEFWELQRSINESIRQMHEMVLAARSRGNLDQANKIMEMQHWADADYEADWLGGMFRGFP